MCEELWSQRSLVYHIHQTNHDGAMKLSKSAQRKEAGMANMHSNGCSGLTLADLKSVKC